MGVLWAGTGGAVPGCNQAQPRALRRGFQKPPMASCSRSWAPLPLQQTLMDSATTHEPTYLLLPLAPAGGMPALHQILRDLHLWPLWPPGGLPALLPPVLQPLPLTGNGAPNFRQGAGRLPFPNPCHVLCRFHSPYCFHSKCMGTPSALSPCIHCGKKIRATPAHDEPETSHFVHIV